jgi:hypothetical protein
MTSVEGPSAFETRRETLRRLHKSGLLESAQLHVRRTPSRGGGANGAEDALLSEVVSRVTLEVVGAAPWFRDDGGDNFSRTILLPGEAPSQAEPVAQEFQFRLTRELAAQGLILPVRVTVSGLDGGGV